MTIQERNAELQVVLKGTENFLGIHKDVQEEMGISSRYSRAIRNGDRCNTETKESHETLIKMITLYRSYLKKRIKSLGITTEKVA